MKSRVLFFGVLACSSFIMSTASANCSREDVTFYLNKGFTHEQVVRMCGAKPSSKNPVATALPVQSAVQASDIETKVFLNSAIKEEVSVSPTHIILTNKNNCISYGTDDGVGFKNEACVHTRTKINREGVKVVVARKPFALLGQPEFVVAGKIQRQILNPEVLSKKELQALSIDYPSSPKQIDIPVHKKADIKKLKENFTEMAL